MAAHGLKLLRLAIGVVFLWFGALKLFPGASPAATLAGRTFESLTFGVIEPHMAVPILGIWEVVIGLGLLAGRLMRVVLILLFAQMLGTITPLFLFPAETFASVPLVPTMEGQYIIKNLVIVSAAMALGATLRGGQLSAEPVVATQPTSARSRKRPPTRQRIRSTSPTRSTRRRRPQRHSRRRTTRPRRKTTRPRSSR
jgi:uncharacterized membrane protein YphA (DoxX/SURF4 family)